MADIVVSHRYAVVETPISAGSDNRHGVFVCEDVMSGIMHNSLSSSHDYFYSISF